MRITREAEKKYRREIEDLEEKLEDYKLARENLLDLNPSNTQTIINPGDFDSTQFVNADIDLGIKIRNVKIKLGVARAQYNELFTDDTAEEVPAEAQKKYHVVHINIGSTYDGQRAWTKDSWQNLLGDGFIDAESHENVPTIIAETVKKFYKGTLSETPTVARKEQTDEQVFL